VAFAAKTGSGSSTGIGRVFLPNPVADLQDQSLTDMKDADYAALQPAYHTTMPDLAQPTVAAAKALYGTRAANTVSRAFQARGLL